MNTFDDIEAMWKGTHPLPLPDAADIIKKASRERNQVANKILIQAGCMLLAIVSLAVVFHFIHFQYASSYIGITLMFACVLIFSFIRFRQSRFLKKIDFSQSPSVLLQQFEIFHKHQKWVNTTGALWYSIVLNIAFAFYFYETLIMTPLPGIWKIVVLSIYIAWMLIATLWLGKRSVKKEHEKTNAVIEKLKQLQSDFK